MGEWRMSTVPAGVMIQPRKLYNGMVYAFLLFDFMQFIYAF